MCAHTAPECQNKALIAGTIKWFEGSQFTFQVCLQCLTWGRSDRQSQHIIVKSEPWSQTSLFRGSKVAFVSIAPYSEHEHTWGLLMTKNIPQTWTTPTERSHWNQSVVDREVKLNSWCQTSSLSASKTLKFLTSTPIPSHLSVLTTASTSGMLALWEIALSSFSSWLFKRRYLFLKQRGRRGEKQDEINRQKCNFMKSGATGLQGLQDWARCFPWLLFTAFPLCSLHQASQLQLGKTSSKIYQMPLPTLTSFEMMALCWLVWDLMVCKYFLLDNAH